MCTVYICARAQDACESSESRLAATSTAFGPRTLSETAFHATPRPAHTPAIFIALGGSALFGCRNIATCA